MNKLSKKDLNYLASSTIASGEVGKEIYRQIMSLDRLAMAAWGAKNLVVNDVGEDIGDGENIKYEGKLQFNVKGPKFKGRVIIYLMPNDTYTIVFGKVRMPNWKIKKLVDRVYNDQLVEIIDNYVG